MSGNCVWIIVGFVLSTALLAQAQECCYSPYGCCMDGKTKRLGLNNKGCGIVDCIDETPVECKKKKASGKLECKDMVREQCAASCNSCKPLDPSLECTPESKHCCWNGEIPIAGGCLDCEWWENNYNKHLCPYLKATYGGCSSGPITIVTYMKRNCPITCGLGDTKCRNW